MTGWIAIERALFEDDFFPREPMSEREAWIWIIAQAAWKDTRHRLGSEMAEVPRGSFFATQREMEHAWLWASNHRVRDFLNRLEKEGLIGRKTGVKNTRKKTQISVCNYDTNQQVGRKEFGTAGAVRAQNGCTKETREQIYHKQEEGFSTTTTDSETPREPEKVGGGGGDPALSDKIFGDREAVLTAIGADLKTGRLPDQATRLGGPADVAEIGRWLAMPGMTLPLICEQIAADMAGKRGGPPHCFRYFTPSMKRLAGRIAADPLTPDAAIDSMAGGRRTDRARFDRRILDLADKFRTGEVRLRTDDRDPFSPRLQAETAAAAAAPALRLVNGHDRAGGDDD